MRASLFFFLAAGVALCACLTEGDRPAGPRDAAPPVDAGSSPGSDAGFGAPVCALDGAVDFGPASDLGPLEAPDLGPIADASPASPSFPDAGPDYILGCRRLEACLAPPDAGLTWDNYAQEFFTTYCTRCHSTANVGGTARGGAPDGRNWDDRASVDRYLPLIRRYVGETMYMPYDEAWALPCERRRELVTWIDEGAP